MRTFAMLLAAALLSNCTTARTRPLDSRAASLVSRSNVVTREQILRLYRDSNVLEALQGLRPRYLAGAGPDGSQRAVVYLDDLPLIGGVADLANIRVDAVKEVIYLTPTEATTRFGTGHTAGAILVVTRQGRGR